MGWVKATNNNQEPRNNAQWNTSCSLAFIDYLQEQAHIGNQSDNGFKPIAWTTIINRLKLQYPPGFDIYQLKNHWTVITGHFKVICEIRKDSGGGWNDEEQRVVANKDSWKNEHAGHEGARQYKKKGFPF